MAGLHALRSFVSRADQQLSVKSKPTVTQSARPASDSHESDTATAAISTDDLSALQRQGVTPTTIGVAQRLMGNHAVLRMIADKAASHSQGCCCGVCRTVQRQTVKPAGLIQRHSSFEHKMLGDVSPEMLQIISSQDNLSEHTGTAFEDVRNDKGQVTSSQTIVARGGDFNGKAINKDMVTHVLDQEIAQINYFKNQNAPKKKADDAESDVASAQN